MILGHHVELAQSRDAHAISMMSRDYIEEGLGWDWTATRVLRGIRDRTTNVAVLREEGQLRGFGIMKYGDTVAHLQLLAVHVSQRRQGLASALLAWLESTAATAGIETVKVEARVKNRAARAFYRSRGYRELERLSGYYRGVEDAVRMEKRLWGESQNPAGLVPE